jgi:hypothetical protein
MGYGGSRQEAGKLTSKEATKALMELSTEDKLGLMLSMFSQRWERHISRQNSKFAELSKGSVPRKEYILRINIYRGSS